VRKNSCFAFSVTVEQSAIKGSRRSNPGTYGARLPAARPAAHHAVGRRAAAAQARDAHGRRRVYVLDEPTNGLHLADLEQLLALLNRLVNSGTAVIVVEHHLSGDGARRLDHRPGAGGAGDDGGRIVFEGTPADLVAARSTLTGTWRPLSAAVPRLSRVADDPFRIG